ncbi:MAG TPA: hypothetical protein VFI65_16825 [Streptosporangiaceae bacterium]|nr:hypothetical protein [Streptosporangiaceae bacterium]
MLRATRTMPHWFCHQYAVLAYRHTAKSSYHGVGVGEVVEQIDHRLAHLPLAVAPQPLPRLPRRLAV